MENIFKKPVYRIKNIGIRVTPEELDELRKLCFSIELSISELVRTAVNEFADKKQKNKVF